MKCCFCKKEIKRWANNPAPLRNTDSDGCCEECNSKIVVPARIFYDAKIREKQFSSDKGFISYIEASELACGKLTLKQIAKDIGGETAKYIEKIINKGGK